MAKDPDVREALAVLNDRNVPGNPRLEGYRPKIGRRQAAQCAMKAKWNFMNIDRTTLSFRKKVVLISFGLAIGCVSLWFTSSMARQLREKENYEVRLWALAIERLGQFNADDPLSAYIMDSRNNIPSSVRPTIFSEVLSSKPDSRPHSLPSPTC